MKKTIEQKQFKIIKIITVVEKFENIVLDESAENVMRTVENSGCYPDQYGSRSNVISRKVDIEIEEIK